MEVKEFKKLISEVDIKPVNGECYIAIAKVGNKASVSFAGQKAVLTTTLYKLMTKYRDLAEVVLEASEVYSNDDL